MKRKMQSITLQSIIERYYYKLEQLDPEQREEIDKLGDVDSENA